MYSNNIVNVQESTTILNACTKNLLNAPRTILLDWGPVVLGYKIHRMRLCRGLSVTQQVGSVIWGYRIHRISAEG